MPVDGDGFVYIADRPDAPSFAAQKWSWTGWDAGAWLELDVDTRAGPPAAAGGSPPPPRPPPPPLEGNETAAALEARRAQEEADKVSLYLGHLISYENMGQARAECVANCTCEPTMIQGTWKRRASLTQLHAKQARGVHSRQTLIWRRLMHQLRAYSPPMSGVFHHGPVRRCRSTSTAGCASPSPTRPPRAGTRCLSTR